MLGKNWIPINCFRKVFGGKIKKILIKNNIFYTMSDLINGRPDENTFMLILHVFPAFKSILCLVNLYDRVTIIA